MAGDPELQDVILRGGHIRLEPLSLGHLDGICEAGLEESIWRWSPEQITSKEEMARYIDAALKAKSEGTALPFATILNSGDKIIGSTRFANISFKEKRAEIGWTWLNPAYQRTFANTEAKFLMLRHAFEIWKLNRVEFKTDSLNEKSRNAILRLGAKEEGLFRKHIICQSGRIRDSLYFSIINSEWNEIKNNLLAKINR